jgi:hypothetical protein
LPFNPCKEALEDPTPFVTTQAPSVLVLLGDRALTRDALRRGAQRGRCGAERNREFRRSRWDRVA